MRRGRDQGLPSNRIERTKNERGAICPGSSEPCRNRIEWDHQKAAARPCREGVPYSVDWGADYLADDVLAVSSWTVSPAEAGGLSVGAFLKCRSFGIGDVAPQPEAQRLITGEAMRPPPPCHLRSAREGNSLRANWVRRTHRGWAWTDGVDAGPDAFPERYRVKMIGSRGMIEAETAMPTVTVELATIPADVGETIRIEVAMIGPMALSRDVCRSFIL